MGSVLVIRCWPGSERAGPAQIFVSVSSDNFRVAKDVLTIALHAGCRGPVAVTYYDRLDVPMDADPETIKVAYRRLAMRLHPDRNGGDPRTAVALKSVNEAYAVLRNVDKRAVYDRT